MKLGTFKLGGQKAIPLWAVITAGGLIIILVGLLIFRSTSGSSTITAAMDAYRAGDTPKAFDLFAQARDKNQINTAEEWNLFGNVYRDSKHLPEALEAYKKAIKLDSGYETAYRNLSYVSVDLAEQEKNQQRLQDAVNIVEAGRKTHPKSITMVEDLIMLYGKMGNTAKVDELKAIREQLLK